MIHIFVDYENIKRIDPAVLALDGATFTLLLGPQNRTLNVPLVEQLMARAAAVELIRLEEPGRNAVDFALAYYLGRKVVTDPTARFYLKVMNMASSNLDVSSKTYYGLSTLDLTRIAAAARAGQNTLNGATSEAITRKKD